MTPRCRQSPALRLAPFRLRTLAVWAGAVLIVVCGLGSGGPAARAEDNPIRGLPFSRFYPLEEIGNSARLFHVGFDPLGRLAIMHEGGYLVLNDSTWLELADEQSRSVTMLNVTFEDDGKAYFGAFGSFGAVDITPTGKLRPRALLPPDTPLWVAATNFTDIASTRDGIYFSGWNGVAFVDHLTGAVQFFSVPQVSRVFTIDDQAYVFSHVNGLAVIDPGSHQLRPVPGIDWNAEVIDQAASLGAGRVLVSTLAGKLKVFDGTHLVPWTGPLSDFPNNRVSGILRLSDGSVAIAVTGKGLFIAADNGEVRLSLTSPQYQRVTELAAREPGVLWLATENGIEKLLYQNPVTRFGQQLGLPVSWPQLARWKNRIVVASSGRMYEAVPGVNGSPARFQPMPGQPDLEIWGLASDGTQLLASTSSGVLSCGEDGKFSTVLSGINVARLVLVDSGFCYVIGESEIAVLARRGGRWVECAPRVPAVGYPSIVHVAGESAWIELGANRAARVTLRDGRLETLVFDHFPWPGKHWVNIGVVGHIVVLSGPPSGRIFFDENTGKPTEAPELQRLFDRAPYWIARTRLAKDGTLWAAHDHGLLMIPPSPDGSFDAEPRLFDSVTEAFPIIEILPGDDVWVSTGRSLYHIDHPIPQPAKPRLRPILTSVFDARTNREIFNGAHPMGPPPQLNYGENSLGFRFFGGTYASRRPVLYEFRLNQDANNWTALGTSSMLTLPDLREGTYRLDVRATDGLGTPHPALLSYEFTIGAPWYRTWSAYLLCGLGALAAVLGLVAWSVRHTRSRNVMLEQLVRERTAELHAAMAKLEEETRNAATLAERARLAGEIHDSLQQGLSGLMLQIDATLKLPVLPQDVRSRLHVARNMVSFTRHEVQHAIWDMESPLLEGTELGDALRKITALISPGATHIDVTVAGSPMPLSPATKHHLLRIAQEAISNAVRHATPDSIAIRLAYEPEAVTLTVTDDGRGFRPDDVLSGGIGHFGLRGLRGRVRKIGGELEIHSAPGEGTVVRIVVPSAVLAHVALQ